MTKHLLTAVLATLVLVCTPAAFPQSCDSTQPIQVCALGSPALRELRSPTQPMANIDLQIISQRTIGGTNKKPKAVDYLVTSPASAGGLFTLNGSNGDTLAVSLTYNNFDSTRAAILSDGTQSTPLVGTTLFRNASISIALADTTILPPPGTYAGSFQLAFSQTTGCGNSCDTTSVLLELEISVPANIRISGLEDMPINYPATSATQQFCVFTTQGVKFGIRADSLHGSGSFVLLGTSGSGDTVAYRASAGPVGGGSSELSEEISTLDQGIGWPGSPSETCTAGGENMQLEIGIVAGELDDAVETTYWDTLTLTVETQ